MALTCVNPIFPNPNSSLNKESKTYVVMRTFAPDSGFGTYVMLTVVVIYPNTMEIICGKWNAYKHASIQAVADPA